MACKKGCGSKRQSGGVVRTTGGMGPVASEEKKGNKGGKSRRSGKRK